MAKREYVYVRCFGGLWRLSKTAWKRYVAARKAGQDTDLDDYGKFLALQTFDVTDDISD